MSGRCKKSVRRVLRKLEASINEGKYYEPHQIYRTVHFRLSGQGEYRDCLESLYKGAMEFLSRDQQTIGTDLANLLIETLEISKEKIFIKTVKSCK